MTLIESGDAITGGPYERSDITLEVGGDTPMPVKSTRILYATMTGTDLALIEPISGYRKEKQTCQVSHTVTELMEDAWTLHSR